MSEQPKDHLLTLVFIVCGLGFLFLAWGDWTSGVATTRSGRLVERASDPGSFNTILAVQVLLGLGGLGGGVFRILRARSEAD